MSTAKSFIYYSTIFMLFGSNLYWGSNTSLQLFYLVLAVNLFLMLLMKRLWVPMGVLMLLGLLVFSAGIGIVRHTDTVLKSSKEVIGISGSAFYFSCFFRFIDFKLEKAFRSYAKMAYWISIIGFIYFPFDYYFHQSMRLRSILSEPAMMAFTCLPALYYYADQWQRSRKHGKELIVIFLALLLAQSSTGFIGILFGVCLFCFRYRRIIVAIPIIVIGLGCGMYFLSDSFAVRFDDTINTFTHSDVNGTNLSTYVLFTNIYVMNRVLQEHPILGNGIGSHGESFYRYIGDLPLGNYEGNDLAYVNSEDASAMGTRLLSDMGFSGAVLLIWFVWRFRPEGDSEIDAMSKAIWIYFLIKIFRGGTYFEDEQYFFVCFYALHHVAIEWQKRTQRPAALPSSNQEVWTTPTNPLAISKLA